MDFLICTLGLLRPDNIHHTLIISHLGAFWRLMIIDFTLHSKIAFQRPMESLTPASSDVTLNTKLNAIDLTLPNG